MRALSGFKKVRKKIQRNCPERSYSFVVSLTERKITHQPRKLSGSTERQNMSTTKEQTAASIVWFGIPADNVERAKKFYGDLFGWKIERFPGPEEYWHIDTGGADETPDGGLKKRDHPQEPITNYVSVNSVTEFSKKIE